MRNREKVDAPVEGNLYAANGSLSRVGLSDSFGEHAVEAFKAMDEFLVQVPRVTVTWSEIFSFRTEKPGKVADR